MTLEESIKVLNEYMQRVDIKAQQMAPSFERSLSAGFLTYQGLRVEVGTFVNESRGDPDVYVSVGLTNPPEKDLDLFYRQLLMWNNFSTGCGHFSLGPEGKPLYLFYRRPMGGMDYHEFADVIADMTATSFNALSKIREMFKV